MKPILFSIGPLHLYAFGTLVALGVTLSLFLMSRQVRERKFPRREDVCDLVAVTIFAGFLGARLLYGIQNISFYADSPLRLFAFWEGGLIFYGGMAGSLIALTFFMKVKKISFWMGLDFLLPYVALTHAFGRIGCFLNGCCTGRPSTVPWAVKFPLLEGPVHPTQLYEALFNFGLFFFLIFRSSRKTFEGEISALYFMIYAVGRFLIEFWRGDQPMWGFLTVHQWLSVFIFVGAAMMYGLRKKETM